MTTYFRAIVQHDIARPEDALPVAGGATWFTHLEELHRDGAPRVIHWREAPEETVARITAARAEIMGLSMAEPHVMGIVNVTPDSFSDGGEYTGSARALAHARRLYDAGATIIDVGGESTRPGALTVPEEAEVARTHPVINAISNTLDVPISVDTRKARVARDAVGVGARMINDVSAFTFDPNMIQVARDHDVPVCVMHAKGDPETMQADPQYNNVLLDVYDYLAERISALEAAGIARDRIVLDPGIGFGKTIAHNLALLSRISILHSLGCTILLGVSRKRFISVIGGEQAPKDRAAGSMSVALQGLSQGVQILRVHDVEDTCRAIRLWRASTMGESHDA